MAGTVRGYLISPWVALPYEQPFQPSLSWFGLGLRFPHYDHVLDTRPKVDWFEIITENYIDAHRGHWEFLADLARTYPIVMHGVSLSIGSTRLINTAYLQKVKALAAHLNTPWVSDHLCFTGVAHRNTHDLLPVPYTEKALSHIVSKIKQVQDILGRPLIIENPSSLSRSQNRR